MKKYTGEISIWETDGVLVDKLDQFLQGIGYELLGNKESVNRFSIITSTNKSDKKEAVK